jgi:hypothetical protein
VAVPGAVMDLCTRKIVGRSLEETLARELHWKRSTGRQRRDHVTFSPSKSAIPDSKSLVPKGIMPMFMGSMSAWVFGLCGLAVCTAATGDVLAQGRRPYFHPRLNEEQSQPI